MSSFGVYQAYYESNLLSSSSAIDISWIDSIQGFLLMVVGVLTGPLFDHGYMNSMLLGGSTCTVLGIMMTSICTKYWQVILAQGVCIGLGAGCLFVPSLAVVSTFFVKRRAIATGIAVSGNAVGGVIYPIVFRKLQPKLGFGWTTRIIGFITLALLVVAIVCMWSRSPSKPARALFQPSAFKSWAYTLQSCGTMFGFIGLYIPIFYIEIYAQTRDITPKEDYAFYLISILNTGQFFGRILPNLFSRKVGLMNMIVLDTFAAAILSFGWIGIDSVAGITIFAVLYGFFAGTYISLIPPVIVELTPDMTMVGTYLGMSLFVAAFGLLFGAPIAGALVNIEKRQFVPAQGFAGGVILLGAMLVLTALVIQMRKTNSWRV